MKTRELVEKTGIDRETLRFYEGKGLIQTPKRSESGYKNYPESTLDRIDFILKAKRAGFTLKEILELIKLKSQKVTCRDGRRIARTKLEELKHKQKALKEMQRILKKFIAACEAEGEPGLDSICHLSFDTICCEKPSKKGNTK